MVLILWHYVVMLAVGASREAAHGLLSLGKLMGASLVSSGFTVFVELCRTHIRTVQTP